MADDRIIKITSADDPQITEFCNIKERDLTRREGQFIAEGKVVLQHLINSQNSDHRFEILKILILQNRLEGVQDLLHTLVSDVPIYTADKSVMNEIAGFEMHRGILALGRYHSNVAIDACDKQNSLVLAACGISNHDNLGSIFRNAAAFGVDKIILDKTCCHPLYRKAVRVSVGSALTVPFELDVDVLQLISEYTEKGYSIYGLSPHGKEMLDDIKPTQKTLLLLGTEGEGLPASILAQVKTAKIAQSGQLDSLNVATASGIALWQIARAMKLI
ncbi:MAG: RNA methyltransferase [Lentilitoribacter sp.]